MRKHIKIQCSILFTHSFCTWILSLHQVRIIIRLKERNMKEKEERFHRHIVNDTQTTTSIQSTYVKLLSLLTENYPGGYFQFPSLKTVEIMIEGVRLSAGSKRFTEVVSFHVR